MTKSLEPPKANKARLDNRWGCSVGHAFFNSNPPSRLDAHPRPSGASALSFAKNSMTTATSLIGTWIGLPKGSSVPTSPPECIWHVVDDSTCVYEQQTDMGLMISWFQYWLHEDGILRYPLTKTTRSMFKGGAEYVPIVLEAAHLTMNGYRFNRVGELPIPNRFDVFPGTRPDESGSPIPHSFKSKVRDHLPEPPKGEQAGTGQPATRSELDFQGSDNPQPESEGRSR